MSLKAAPRRDIVDVVRVGDWGDVSYKHRLSCGHVEERKRPAKTSQVACSSCLLAKNFDPVERAVVPALPPEDDYHYDPVQAEIAYVEGQAGRIKAGLAGKFGVELDSVDVVIGERDGAMRVISAVVYLDGDQAKRLSS